MSRVDPHWLLAAGHYSIFFIPGGAQREWTSSEKAELFKGRHFNHLLIIQAVRWYVTYKLSSTLSITPHYKRRQLSVPISSAEFLLHQIGDSTLKNGNCSKHNA